VKEPLKNQTRIILDSIADGVFTVDADFKITSFNRAAENITGIRIEDALGRHCWEVFRASICEKQCSLKSTMKTGQPIVNQPIFFVNLEGDRVPISISTALLRDEKGEVIGGVESFRDLSVVEELRKELAGRHSFLDIISKNNEMQRLFRMLEQVSESEATILLEGESGTGKGLFAKAIHSLSARKKGPFVVVNCGSLPDTLLESELFGYEKGAHSTAFKDKPGRMALAEGGTLFLDEIGDISPALQIGLLRVLQERVYEPLGSITSHKANVRIVAATNKNLADLVEKGTFRQDLYYRINVVRLVLPPLRERREDIPLLIDYFIRKFNRLNGKEINGLLPDVLPLIMAHNFPGNIRELENIIEYATVVCKNSVIGIEHLPDHLRGKYRDSGISTSSREEGEVSTWQEVEKSYVYEVLRKNHWNRKITAAQMGIHPSTLWRKIKRLNIQIPEESGRRSGGQNT